MTAQQLPERPNLEQLKRQAKDLLRSGQAGDPAALARFHTLPAFAKRSADDIAYASLALHDAQSVIAREFGFNSWSALRERVEELTLEFDDAVIQFIEAATDSRTGRAERLLALYPRIASANFHTALLLGDASAVARQLAEQPALAVRGGGPRGWEPLLYVCHNSLRRDADPLGDRAGAIARQLFALGADANARYPWLHHFVQRPVLWGATCVTRSLSLAVALLEAGADPNDGVTLTIAAGGGDLPTLELLHAHGADANHPWATDGSAPLYAILQWATTADGVHWLLDHGAAPDAVFAENGETPLHVAARAWDVATVEQLVSRGADVARRRRDGRMPYAVAELNGNRLVAEWLAAHGAPTELSEVDRMVGMCSRGDRVAAEALLAARPALREELSAEHYVSLIQAAERGNTKALEAMLVCGFDPNRGDEEIGKTALHGAAHEGWAEAVRLLLAYGARPDVRDREFKAQPLIWAADGSRQSAGGGRDFAAVGRLLLDAGSPIEWEQGAEPREALLEVIAEWRRARQR